MRDAGEGEAVTLREQQSEFVRAVGLLIAGLALLVGGVERLVRGAAPNLI